MIENLIEINGYDGYYFSFSSKLFGVISKRSGQLLKPRKDKKELTYRLYKNGVLEDVSILKILALVTFSARFGHEMKKDDALPL